MRDAMPTPLIRAQLDALYVHTAAGLLGELARLRPITDADWQAVQRLAATQKAEATDLLDILRDLPRPEATP